MTKTLSKRKKIVLGIVAAVLVLAVTVVGVYWFFFLPGSWKPIDRFGEFQGILDSPIQQVTLRHIGYEVTFTDEDLIQSWQQGLEQLQLRKTRVNPRLLLNFLGPWVGGNTNAATLVTETGEYTITFWEDEIFLSLFCYAPNDWANLPFEETYYQAVERQGILYY